MVAKKRKGEAMGKTKTTVPSHFQVHRMTDEANHLKKFEPLDTRDFVDFLSYEELSIENIKEACKNFFEMPAGTCDVLLTD